MNEHWGRTWLIQHGFSPPVQLRSLDTAGVAPSLPGVYAVTHDDQEPIAWVPNCGGWFKGRDPGVPTHRLEANWVNGANTVYIGKSNDLRRRLREFARFGLGEPIGHWGGRLIWHLPNPHRLHVQWMTSESNTTALRLEARLIAEFSDAFGKPPFANRPQRDGR